MILGLKVNADRESFDRIDRTNAPFVEVWFNVNKADSYQELFDELKRRHIQAGLHFWGVLDGNIGPNIAYPDAAILDKSKILIRQTIDIAATNGHSYVNIHPGAAALYTIDFEANRFNPAGKPVDMDDAIGVFLENASELSAYAKAKNIVFTVETVPARAGGPTNIYELPTRAIVAAAKQGLFIANDFCHTAAGIITHDSSSVWEFVRGSTMALLTQTRLIHLGFVVPPYDGTDIHDSLDNPILDTDAAVPNKQQMIELLKLFKNREDVWILVEPKEDHVKNYHLARELLEQAGEVMS